jgi:putative SOS response-associated peptidase YedK
MCGRFVIELTPELVRKVFGVTGDFPDWPARYNIAPTQLIPVVRDAPDGSRRLALLRWGLVPSWSKEFNEGLINARCETVNEKPSFRQAFRQRRCIIPASGFYEWQKVDKGKVPHYIRMADGSPMPFAGIWESWRSPEGQALESCAILTTAANAAVAPIHDRMPVILHPDEFGRWLDREVHEAEQLAGLFAPYPADRLEAYRVSTLVNDPAHDFAECLRPPATFPA